EDNGYFDSSIVNDRHAEIWAEGTKIFIRDTGSSSGTFVNRKQLTSPHRESEPEEIKSGDVVQFGLDWVFTTEKTPYRTIRARVTCVFPRPGAQ
ncbi:hypothetical protein B0H16DRAFT_1243472, partial [Mycena metata]